MAVNRVCDVTGPPGSSADTVPALLRELIEALTALGNYLAAVDRMAAAMPQRRLDETLLKTQKQYERAAEAARQLHRSLGT